MSQTGREELTTQFAEAEAGLLAAKMRMVPSLPIPPDLTLRQLQVLASLRTAPDSTGQALAELLGVTTPTVSGLVDRVAAKGWVERQQDPLDRRRVLLRLSDAGEEVLAALETPAWSLKQQILGELEEQEVVDLVRLARRMRDVAVEIADRHVSSAGGTTPGDEVATTPRDGAS